MNIYFMRYSLVDDPWQHFSVIGPAALNQVIDVLLRQEAQAQRPAAEAGRVIHTEPARKVAGGLVGQYIELDKHNALYDHGDGDRYRFEPGPSDFGFARLRSMRLSSVIKAIAFPSSEAGNVSLIGVSVASSGEQSVLDVVSPTQP